MLKLFKIYIKLDINLKRDILILLMYYNYMDKNSHMLRIEKR